MDLHIPKGSEKFILFQRTEYLYLARNKNPLIRYLYKVLVRLLSFNRYVGLEAALFPGRINTLFSEDMQKEFMTIQDHLPKHAGKILDIGCGVAGIDALLYHRYGADASLYLLDKTALDTKVFYFFEKSGSFYNSLSVAKDLLLLNGVPSSHIHMQEVTDKNEILFKDKFDLVISLISWGFHYPVSTYLDAVYDKMEQGGTLIIDVRKGTDGEALLRRKFGELSVVFDEQKYRRVAAVKLAGTA